MKNNLVKLIFSIFLLLPFHLNAELIFEDNFPKDMQGIWSDDCDAEYQEIIYKTLIKASIIENGGPVGSRALMSLRIEKGYGSWSREYSPEVWPHESGVEKLCKLDKDFLNKTALVYEKMNQPSKSIFFRSFYG